MKKKAAAVKRVNTIKEQSLFSTYRPPHAYDEMMDSSGEVRPEYQNLWEYLSRFPTASFKERVDIAEMAFVANGVTFTLSGDSSGLEKIIPFDILPRILGATEWATLEKGLIQRVRALNAFLKDVYSEQEIFKERVLPDSILKNPVYRPEMRGVKIPGDIYVSISGIDLVRDEKGVFRVLEDNLRCPSGVSYVLENREVLQRTFPELFAMHSVRPVFEYPQNLLNCLASLGPQAQSNVVLLSPGVFNSAYFEHTYLANKMGIHLVEGSDLAVLNKKVFMKTTSGLEPVDVIYRRIDDDFLDPKVFRGDSLVGVPGLFEAYRAGNVVLANAIGNGIADDKSIYPHTPSMIRFYLGEEPILPIVETFLLDDPKVRDEVFSQIDKMVIKPTAGSGGYGILIGSQSSAAARKACFKKVKANPGEFVAQREIRLSSHPTYIQASGRIRPRYIDLRPFVLMDAKGDAQVLAGGLSRVALRKGSLIVNSSQGGGGKDTWVLQ